MELPCPLHLLFIVFDVSPTYWMLHTLHVMTYITLLDLQLKFPLMGYERLALLGDHLGGVHVGASQASWLTTWLR